MKSINTIIILFCIFFYQVSNFPQSNDSTEESYNQAIQFYIINQVIIAYKYNFSEFSAIRFTLNASGLFRDEDSDEIKFRNRTTDTIVNYYNQHYTNSNHFYELKLQYLYSIKIHKIFQLFLGCGPFVNYKLSQSENSFEYYNSNGMETSNGYSKSSENTWNIGISALIGLECIVYKNINLFAEYEATVNRGWRDYDDNSNSQVYATNNNYNIWAYELKGIRIGLSIYF